MTATALAGDRRSLALSRTIVSLPEQITTRLESRPTPLLWPVINRYTWHRYEGFPAGIHQGLPSRHLTLMVSLEGPFRIVTMPGGQSPGSFQAFIGGLHAGPAQVAHQGRGCGVAIEVTPLGARRFFGMPAGVLAASVVDLRDVWGPSVDELAERLAAVADWRAQVGILDDVLTRRLVDSREVPPELGQAWCMLVETGGQARIADVAATVGWSRRHLSARFKGEYGLSTKQAARVLRFERASAQLASGRRLADVAAACGYSDQPHLNEDWRALAGQTPTEWLRDELRDPADTP